MPGAQQPGEVRAGTWALGPDPWGDCVITQRAPGIEGDYAYFLTLPSGDILVEGGKGDFAPLAEGVEKHIPCPYEAYATRQDDDRWAIGASRIDVVEFSYPDAAEISLSCNDGRREFLADGQPRSVWVPELEQAGKRVASDYFVDAKRIDGDFWRIEVGAL
jgi:hypothetical protein